MQQTSSLSSASRVIDWTVDEIKWGSKLYANSMFTMITHPLETLTNIGKLILHPLDTCESIGQQIVEHPLGSLINIGLSYGTGYALNYALESSVLTNSTQSSIEVKGIQIPIEKITHPDLALTDVAISVIAETTRSAGLAAQGVYTTGLNLLRTAARTLSFFEFDH